MFEAMKMAGALAGLMKNKEGLKAAGERIKTRLAELRAQGSGGGGAVRATVDGRMRVLEITFDPTFAQHGLAADPAAAAPLIAEAVNRAIETAQELARREIKKEADALGLPDIPGVDKFLGG